MDVTITEFRRQLFSLANQALEGEEVWFTHRGRRIKIVPEDQPASRLSRITPIEIINSEMPTLDDVARKAQMMAEMEKAWEKDWESL
ncbi:MAG: hypothetical protein ABR905_14305 [Terracidiphilus sp.]|jgi:antitoxin (DNA-binding transcriptional repressor) of toxin-antitoxin stability system